MVIAICGLVFAILSWFVFGIPFGVTAVILGTVSISQTLKEKGQIVLAVIDIASGLASTIITAVSIIALLA